MRYELMKRQNVFLDKYKSVSFDSICPEITVMLCSQEWDRMDNLYNVIMSLSLGITVEP